MESRKLYLALDLKNDENLISKYKEYHAPGNTWPEVLNDIKASGITDMEIYLTGNRLFMVLTVDESYHPDKKAEVSDTNHKTVEWEALMDTFQQRLPWAKGGQKWVPMERIFKLR